MAITTTNKLSFGVGNSKLSKSIATFSLPAGFTCPFAKECFSKANRLTGKLIDGKHCKFRCFAASQKCMYPPVRKARWGNLELLKEAGTVEKMGSLIQRSLPRGMPFVRIHVSGDYYSETYFLAWLNVALNNPTITFYGYTKALPHIVKYQKHIPQNFRLTASKGGTHDHLIGEHGLKYAEVVFSTSEAEDKGLRLDHDDGLAMYGDSSFALLLHGMQPAKTEAAKAWEKIRRNGIGGYNKQRERFEVSSSTSFKIFIDKPEPFKFIPQSTRNNRYASRNIIYHL